MPELFWLFLNFIKQVLHAVDNFWDLIFSLHNIVLLRSIHVVYSLLLLYSISLVIYSQVDGHLSLF